MSGPVFTLLGLRGCCEASDQLRWRILAGMNARCNEQFRLEAANAISSLGTRWRNWEDWHPPLNDEAERMLAHLESITQKVSDLQQFMTVCQEMAPTIGLEATSSLMVVSQDFQEFSSHFARVTAQLKWWRWD